MGTTDDPNKYRKGFQDELSRLKDLANEDDAAVIRTWANTLTGEYSTRQNLVLNTRKLSDRADAGGFPPLVEMKSAGDFYALHDSIRDGSNPDVKDGGLAESTLRNVRQAARNFFEEALDRDWAGDIKVGGPQKTKVTEDDIFVAEEVEALFDAARNSRDKALMATLLATGQRISALLSLRIRDIDLDGRTGFIYLNDEAIGLKGAAGKRPLIWATEYLKNWLDIHPARDDPQAAVFCMLKDQDHPERSSDMDPLSSWGVNQQLRRIRKRAGIDKPVNPHNFRHSAVTRMVRDGVPDQQIKWMVGWKPDSTQFERYTHLQDNEMAQAVLEHYDIAEPESKIGRPQLETCPSCGAALDGWVDPVACPGCGLSLSYSAAEVANMADDIKDEATESAMESLDPEEIEAFRAIREAVDDPVALAEKLSSLED